MSWLSQAFGMGKHSAQPNPASAAQPYLDQIPGVGHQYFDPYIKQGRQAGQRLGGEYEKQLDPTTFMNQLMQQYKPSEGYQSQREDLMRGMGAQAAMGGYAGTPMAQQQYGQQAERALSQDQQQYLQNVLGIYQQGMGGEQDIYNKGFQASGGLADFLGSNLSQQGGLAFQGQAQQNQNHADKMGALSQALGGVSGLLGLFGG